MNSPCASARARPLLGTLVEIRVAPGGEPRAVECAFDAVARVGRLMSAQDPSSELSAVNRAAQHAPVEVDAWTFEVFQLALELFRRSAGAFDCTVGARAPGTQATSADIELCTQRRVRYRRPLQVEFGGIAKGYAVDRAVEVLQGAGVPAGVVNAGGDLRVFGEHAEPVHLRLPGGGLMGIGEIAGGALATSSAEIDPPLGLPLLDGRGGRPRGAQVASVFAASCALADGLTKAVAALGAHSAPLLFAYGAQALCLDPAGRWRRWGAAG
ncbi:MAG TPA: FAD:protein FMN transferase [Burkholderiales bacterium]